MPQDLRRQFGNTARYGVLSRLASSTPDVQRRQKSFRHPDSARGVLAGQIAQWLADHESSDLSKDDFYGVLHGRHGDTQLLTESEEETLRFTLAAIRLGGWFSKWLDLQVHAIATNNLPGDRHPSPLQIAGSLTTAIAEWQEELDAAKRVAARRPDLLFPVMRCEGDDPELVLETPPPEPAAKPRRAPKRSRKAA